MIPLDDTRWMALDVPHWVHGCLHDCEAGDYANLADLCISSCDEGALQPWSFAVVPHFVRLAREAAITSVRTELLSAVGAVAVHRIWWHHRFVPTELRDPFEHALADARRLLPGHLRGAPVEQRRRLASLVAYVGGHPEVACPVEDARGGVRCRSCQTSLPMSDTVHPVPAESLADALTVPQLARWMDAVGYSGLGDWLREGETACPACGEPFLPSRPAHWNEVAQTPAVFEQAIEDANDAWLAVFRRTIRHPEFGSDWMGPFRDGVRHHLRSRARFLVPLLQHPRERVVIETLKLLAELDVSELETAIRSAAVDERRGCAVVEVLHRFGAPDALVVFADRHGVVGALAVLALADVAPERWVLLRVLALVDSELVDPHRTPLVARRRSGERVVNPQSDHWIRNRIHPELLNRFPDAVLVDATDGLIRFVQAPGSARWAAAACLIRVAQLSDDGVRQRICGVLDADALWEGSLKLRQRFGLPGSRHSLRKLLFR